MGDYVKHLSRVRWVVLVVALGAAVGACGGDGPPLTPDAGPDAGAAIAEPLPPVLTPCPPGWREIPDANGVATCDPWPATGYRTDCAWDEAHFPGTPGCSRVGTDCPADGWPADLPTDRAVVFVDDDAAPVGDGLSRATAFNRIGDAVVAAPDGAVIAVATGRYDEAVRVATGMTLWGACVSGTRIVTSAPSDTTAALTLAGGSAGVRNLGVDGTERAGIEATEVTGASIDSVVVAGARNVGVRLSGGSLAAATLVVRGTRAGAAGTGFGVYALDGARVMIGGAVVAGNQVFGVVSQGPETTVTVQDAAIRETALAETVDRAGAFASNGGTVHLERAAIEQNDTPGIRAVGAGSRVDAADVVIRELVGHVIMRAVGGALGYFRYGSEGLGVREGATASLERVLIEGADGVAVRASRETTSLSMRDGVLRDTHPAELFRDLGRAIEINSGAHAVLERLLIAGCREAGVYSNGGTIEATSLLVRDIDPSEATGQWGIGIWSEGTSMTNISRVRVQGARVSGVEALLGAIVVLSDAFVEDVQAASAKGGFGLSAHRGGVLSVSHFFLADTALCGVVVGRDGDTVTQMDLADGVVTSTPVGACVQVDGYDTARLQHDVEYRDVGVPLRATAYEVPDALPPSTLM